MMINYRSTPQIVAVANSLIGNNKHRDFDDSYRYPSRFIFNVDKALLAYTNELDDSLVYETNWNITSSEKMLAAQASGPVFKPGDRIVHSILGSGAVGDIEHDKAAYMIKFDDLGTMRKITGIII